MKKILAIDDQMDNLISIKAVLQTYMPDCRVMLAQTGNEGIEVALKEKPDVILLDIIMPVMDGFETCRKLKSSKWTSNIPIIMVTAIKTDVDSRIKGLELGADAFLSKPYDPAELSAQIRVMLRIKAAEDKLRVERDDLDKLVDIKTEELVYQSTILKNVRDAAISTDLDFKITSWNDAATEIYGFTAAEVLGSIISDVLKTEYPNQSRESALENLMTKGYIRGEYIQYNKKGIPLIINSSVSLIKDNSGNNIGFVALNRDITELKKAQNEIKISEKKFRLLFQNQPTGFALHEIILDSEGNPCDYKFLEVNPAFEQLTGLNAKDIIGKTCLEVLPDTEIFWFEKYGKVAIIGEPITFENYSQALDKYYRVNSYSPEYGKFATVFIDITERIKAEKEVQAVAKHYQSLIENASDGVVLLGTDGQYKYISPSARKMFGYNLSEKITLKPDESTYPEDLPMVLTELEKIITNPDYSPTLQYRFQEKNGNWKWIESTFRNLYTEPSVEAIVINFRDITERIIAENSLKETDVRFRKLSEHVPGMIYQFKRTPDGKYTAPFSSEAIKDIFGCQPEDVLNDFSPIGNKIIPEDFNKVINSIELSAKELTVWECEYRVNVDGKIKWLYGQSTPELMPDGSIIWHGYNSDISERKRVEEELRISQHIIEGIINAIPIRVFWKDKDLKYLGCNSAFAKDAGYENNEEIIGKDDFELVWSEHANLYRNDDMEVINSGNSKLYIEEPQKTPNGDTITLLTSKIPLKDSEGNIIGVLGTYMDITERKLAEAALIESEIKFKAIFENNSAAMAIIEADTTISMVNDAYCKISGYSKEDVIGTSWTTQIPPDDLERLKEYNRLRLNDPKSAPEKYEFTFYRKDGEIANALMSVALIHQTKQVITSFIDITLRKHAEQALSYSEEKFSVAFKTSPYAITITRPEDGVIIEANDAFYSLTGYSFDETNKKSIIKLGLWANNEERELIIKELSEYGSVKSKEIQFLKKDGSILHALFSAQVINLQGNMLILSSINDISERIDAENKIKLITKNWNLTFDSIQDGICLLDSNNNIIQSNKAFLNFTKKTTGEMECLKCHEIIHEKDCMVPDCPFINMKKSKKRVSTEMIIGDYACEIIVDPIFDENGKINGAVHIIKDITKQKEAQSALIASENKYRLIAENTADVIWIMDMNMNFTYTSPSVYKLRGFTTEESLKMPLEKILTPEAYKEVLDIFIQQTEKIKNKDFNQDTYIVVELDQIKKDGTIIKTENTISVLFDKDNNAINILGITRDITERKKAQDELVKNEIRLKSLVGILQHKNADSQEFLDIALEEAIKLTESAIGYIYYYLEDKKIFILNTWSKDVMEQCEVMNPQTIYELDKTGIWGEAVRQKKPILINNYNEPNNLKKGYPKGHVQLERFMTIPVFSENKIVAVVGVGNKKTDYDESDVLQLTLLMDVVWKANEHKKAEIALIKSEEKFRTLVENLPVGIYRSTPDGKLISINSAFAEMFEISPNSEITEIFVGDLYFDKNDRKNFIKTIESKGFLSHYEVRLKTLENKPFWVSISGIAVKGGNNKILFIDGVISNIDDRIKSEELVRQKTEELQEHKDHLEELVKSRTAELERSMIAAEAATKAKSEFLANMSHEIRTPMNAIVGFSELLHSSITEPKQISQVNSIRTSAKSLMGIINDILDLSKVEAGKMKLEFAPVNIKSIIHEIESVFKAKISEKGLRFIVEYGKALPSTLLLDEIRLRQVLFNLVGNAVKFTDKGHITITVDCLLKKNSNSLIDLLIKVEDTGIGIPPEQQELIFEAFSQVKGQNTKKYGGTGLGLTITKRLVEIMHGSIVLSSNQGTGSIFEVHLPDVEISEEQTIVSTENVFNPRSVLFEKAKILICDDNENNRSLIIDLLENSELDIIEAENGKQAIQYATEFLPDLILMDLKMPEIDGYEATKIIKSNKATSSIPIVALSASTSIVNQSNLPKDLFSATIMKPVNIHQLIKALKVFLKITEYDVNSKDDLKKEETEEFILTEDMMKSMPEVIAKLKNYFLPESVKADEEQNIDRIEIFAKDIIAFGEKFSLNTIIYFGNELFSYAENFEIEKISEKIKELPSVINNIIKIVEERK